MKYLLLALFLCILYFKACASTSLNNRPIIGVLSQEYYKHPGMSYIAASYVKFVEGSGARVVPILLQYPWSLELPNFASITDDIFKTSATSPTASIPGNEKPYGINQTDEYYEYIVNHVNGILLPGGGTYFNISGGYADAGVKLYKLAVEKNKDGDYFPVFGICLGFELISYAAANEEEHRMRCEHYNEAVPLELNFKSAFRSRMFGDVSFDLIGILVKENVTANFHYFCLTLQNMTELGLDKEWLFMTMNHDTHGLEYISTLEHSKYPIYGVQFHPEKNNYEWKVGKNHPHTAEGVQVSQYFGNFFVNEARKNYHEFPSEEEERKHLIYNRPVINTSKQSIFMQIYAFMQ